MNFYCCHTTNEHFNRLSICLTTFALPVVLTWLGYLPFMTRLLHRIRPFIYPSITGRYHDQPLPHLIGNAPTVGQTGYIGLLVILNIVFLATGYKTLYPDNIMQWYENRYQELMAYFMWRTGVLAFCQMPVLFLFSSRNNILLWLTNWSHSTYMLLHRWIARLFLLQTLLHSILALVLYKNTGSYSASSKLNWWIWGIVATVAAVVLVLTSLLVFRQRNYEFFLITHIVMAVICVVGCWYHVWYGYENCFGYETWLYTTIAVWFFDRLARIARIAKTGMRRATVTDIGPSIARIDVPGVLWTAPGHCVYVYFPTVNALRPWENHPFSMIPTASLNNPFPTGESTSEVDRIEKNQTTVMKATAEPQVGVPTTSGVSLFIRKRGGMTGNLGAQDGLLTLLEGPYPTIPRRSLLQSDRLLLVGGGIGITGLLPFLRCHPNIKLFHSLKTTDRCLVDSLGPLLDGVREKDIVIGQRLRIEELLRFEADLGWRAIAVVVCGPAAMCDDVRAIVAALGREKVGKCTFDLEVDAFSW